MAYRLKLSARAVRETGEAFEWYESRRTGLGGQFEAALEVQLQRLERDPRQHPEVLPGVHRILLQQFPYGVFYAIRQDLVHVLAVVHHARNPARWPGQSPKS